MKSEQTFSLFTLCLLSILCLLNCAPKTGQKVDVTQEIIAANQSFMAAFNANDANKVTANYTANARLFPPNSKKVEGSTAIKNMWQSLMDLGVAKAILKTTKAEGLGNTAIEEGNFTLYTTDGLQIDAGSYLVIWQKEQGQWKLHQDIWNSDVPNPTQGATAGDMVGIFMNNVLSNKKEQFEDFVYNKLKPATQQYYPKSYETVKVLHPLKANTDGTWTYTFLMYPRLADQNGYSISNILQTAYGEAKAKDILQDFQNSLKDGQQNAQSGNMIISKKW